MESTHCHLQKSRSPFSIDWILRKEDSATSRSSTSTNSNKVLSDRVDKIKNVIRVYEQANPFRYPGAYYKDLSMVKYKLDKCSPKTKIMRNAAPTFIDTTPSAPTSPVNKPPSPARTSCTCQSVSHDIDGGRDETMVVYDDVFMDDRITMTTLPSKVAGMLFTNF